MLNTFSGAGKRMMDQTVKHNMQKMGREIDLTRMWDIVEHSSLLPKPTSSEVRSARSIKEQPISRPKAIDTTVQSGSLHQSNSRSKTQKNGERSSKKMVPRADDVGTQSRLNESDSHLIMQLHQNPDYKISAKITVTPSRDVSHRRREDQVEEHSHQPPDKAAAEPLNTRLSIVPETLPVIQQKPLNHGPEVGINIRSRKHSFSKTNGPGDFKTNQVVVVNPAAEAKKEVEAMAVIENRRKSSRPQNKPANAKPLNTFYAAPYNTKQPFDKEAVTF